MRILSLAVLVAVLSTVGCVMPKSQDLGKVAADHGLVNMTTGDGTFENYKATNFSSATEFGFGFGFPFFKFMEVFPAYSNEDLLGEIAIDTKDHGGNAMINVEPVNEGFYGFIFGLYIDSTSGTGIRTGG